MIRKPYNKIETLPESKSYKAVSSITQSEDGTITNNVDKKAVSKDEDVRFHLKADDFSIQSAIDNDSYGLLKEQRPMSQSLFNQADNVDSACAMIDAVDSYNKSLENE